MCLRPLIINNPNFIDESTTIKHRTDYVRSKYANSRNIFGRTIQVPCGTCMECVRRRQNQLAWLCEQEMKSTGKDAAFVTLTYNEAHLPMVEATLTDVDPDTGEVTTRVEKIPTCSKKSIQNFLKRLRKEWKNIGHSDPLRVFWCTEYGSKRHRPHAHLIIFNTDYYEIYPLLKSCWTTPRKNQYDPCEELGYVYCDIAPAGKSSLKYIAKYGCKPTNSNSEDPCGFSQWERDNCYSASNPDGIAERPVVRHSLRLGYSYLFDDDGTIKQHVVDEYRRNIKKGVLFDAPCDEIIYGADKTGKPIKGTLPDVFKKYIFSSADRVAQFKYRCEQNTLDFFSKLIDNYNNIHPLDPYPFNETFLYNLLQDPSISESNLGVFNKSNLVEVFNRSIQEKKDRYRQSYDWLKQEVGKSLF